MTTTLTAGRQVAPPEPIDITTCDRCGARGLIRFVLPNGLDLVFCQHHARDYWPGLCTSTAYSIYGTPETQR